MSTRTGKGRKRKRIGKRTDKEQSAAFVRAAKEMGLDESGKDFAKTIDKLLKPKRGGSQ